MCFGDYVMYKGQEYYKISSCDMIEIFYNIRIDLDKLKYATHITKIIHDVTTENENTYKIMQLYLNTLYMISESAKSLELILIIFKIKLLCFLGFKPNIDRCLKCGENTIKFFSVQNDGAVCENCGKLDKSVISINESTFMALKYIILSPTKKLFSFDLKNESLKQLELISKIYFNEKLEKQYKME